MSWWLWLLAGLALIGAELMTPGGFFVFFFGVAALVVGTLTALAVTEPVWLQWLLFSLLAVVSLLLFRNPLLRMIGRDERGMPIDTLVDEIAVPIERIAPGEVGRVELRGTTWSARNDDRVAIDPGRRCRVHRVDGLMLWIRQE